MSGEGEKCQLYGRPTKQKCQKQVPRKNGADELGGGPSGKTPGCWGVCFGVCQIGRAAGQDALVRSKASHLLHTSAHLLNGADKFKNAGLKKAQGQIQKRRLEKSSGCAVSLLQRPLHPTLGCFFPTTAGSAQFCLLCCQPEPVPESLPARPPSLTRRCPCSLPVWSGQPIHMVHRTYSGPRHSISQTPLRGTERYDPPQMHFGC